MAHIVHYPTKEGRHYLVKWRERGRYRSKSFTHDKDARTFKTEVERRLGLGELYNPNPGTLGEFLRGWLGRFEQRVSPVSYERGKDALEAVVGPCFGAPDGDLLGTPLPSLRAAEVEDAVQAVACRAPRQAHMGLQKLKQALRNAQDRGARIDPALLRIEPPRVVPRERRALTWEEVRKLAAACSQPNLVLFAALTGMRQGELFDLRSEDVESGRVQVRKGKTAAARRYVYLPAAALNVLTEQLNGGGYVFPTPQGERWTKDNFGHRVFRPAVKEAGLAPFPFHGLRHTYISLAVAAGLDPLTIAKQVGHTDASLIFKVYGHAYEGSGARAAQTLDEYLGRERKVEEA